MGKEVFKELQAKMSKKQIKIFKIIKKKFDEADILDYWASGITEKQKEVSAHNLAFLVAEVFG